MALLRFLNPKIGLWPLTEKSFVHFSRLPSVPGWPRSSLDSIKWIANGSTTYWEEEDAVPPLQDTSAGIWSSRRGSVQCNISSSSGYVSARNWECGSRDTLQKPVSPHQHSVQCWLAPNLLFRQNSFARKGDGMQSLVHFPIHNTLKCDESTRQAPPLFCIRSEKSSSLKAASTFHPLHLSTRAWSSGGESVRAPAPFSGQSRGFQSTPYQSGWFWPSKDNSGPNPPLEPPLVRELDPIFSDRSQNQDRTLESEIEFAEIWPEAERVGVLSEGAPGASAAGSGWAIWKVLAPLSGAVVVVLDGVHAITGLPWWLTIVVSTFLMRAALFPLAFVQIKKAGQIVSIFQEVVKRGGPETPFLTSLQRFAAARKALGAPNPAWFLAVPAVQIPVFVSSMFALREMAADGHPGFDTGGMLWFTDLTLPAGLGLEAAIFPVALTTLYLSNIHLAFGALSSGSRFLKIYKGMLQALAVPAFVGSFYLPQGVLLYWVTNNFCSLSQGLAFRNNAVRAALNLPRIEKASPREAEKNGVPITEEMIESMDVNELVQIAATCQAQRRPQEAIKFLQKALVKVPEEATIFFALGKTHAGMKKWEEAAEFHGQAVMHAKDDELRGKALYGSGIAMFNQGKVEGAVLALREAASLRPNDVEGQLSLASVLSRNGDKAEALEVLHRAAGLEPKIQKYVDVLEEELRTQADSVSEAKGR